EAQHFAKSIEFMVAYPQTPSPGATPEVKSPPDDSPKHFKPLKILSLSSEYPNPAEPAKGLFVQARLQAMSRLVPISIAAPVALLDYANPHGRLLGFREIPRSRLDGKIEVLHPRWMYPPRGGVFNAFCMYLRMLPVVKKLKREGKCDVIDAHFAHP